MKQIKKILVAMILVFALFLVACEEPECPDCQECKECNVSEVCQGLIDPASCPEAPACPDFDANKECAEAGWTKECPEFDANKECAEAGWTKECPEGIVAPESVEFYADDVAVGGTAKFDTEIEPANAFAGLVWFSADPSIATVAEDGTITGVKPGKVEITVKSALNSAIAYTEEIEVVEKGLQDYEIAEREKNAIVAALQGYVSASFDLPTTWNASAKVVYTDPNGKEITRFEMPDLGEASSQNYALSGSVTYKDSVSEFNVTLKLVKVAEGKNDYEKVIFATEVAEAFLYEYLEGTPVAGDVFLPVSVYGVSLNWATNKAYVLTADGKYTKPNNNDVVTYTITPKLGAASASKTFAVTAKGYSAEEKINYLLKSGELKALKDKEFVGSIPLPEYDAQFGIKLTYVSGSPKLIANDGTIDAHAYDTEKQKVTFTVTAVYSDLNAPAEAFTKVFTFDVYVAAYNDATQDIIEFAADHAQFAHYPYGGAEYDALNEKQVIIAADDYKPADGWTFAGDENFKVDENNEVQVVTQYFRYHEATLVVTKEDPTSHQKASYVWTVNVGIGAEPHITYLGGRSQSYQASANPNERGDSLQGFSKWDKYVGVVANNTERTSQQYWSEFSGYTAYVDVPTGYNKTIYTLDAEGNVTIYATDAKEHVRQQMFFMEFAVLRIKETKEYYSAADGKTKVYYPILANKESVRSTYGGNFGSLYVNESGRAIDIPVSALSMGGTFIDNVDMKTYTKAAITVYAKADKKDEVTLVDDWGSNTSVKREQSWALDGYRPAFMAAPKVDAVLTEGKVDVEYKFTVGIQLSQEHYDSNYIQYGIKSEESKLWGTPYVVLPKNGIGFAWHSQTLYSFSAMGGGYIAGQDMSLPLYVSRYYRHAENEELSDYIRNDVRTYFTSLTGLTTDEYNAINGAAAFAKVAIQFDDLGINELKKIEALQDRLDALKPSWKAKEDVKRAVDALARIVDVAENELKAQKAYADLTERLYKEVGDAYKKANITDKNATFAEAAEYVASADFQALLATAKRNYNSLTPGQKDLYDKGYTHTNATIGTKFDFSKKETTYVEDSIALVTEIAGLSDKVNDANKAKVKELYDKAKGTLADKGLIIKAADDKITDLKVVYDILGTKATTADVTAAKATFAKLADPENYPAYTYKAAPSFVSTGLYFTRSGAGTTDDPFVYAPVANPNEDDFNDDKYYVVDKTPLDNCSPKQAYVAASFKDVKNEDGTTTWGLDVFFNDLLAQEKAKAAADEKAAAEKRVANMAKTVTLANEIKEVVPTLPASKDVKTDGLGALKDAYNAIMKYDADATKSGKIDELVRLYKTLGLISVDVKNDNPSNDTKLAQIKAILVAVTGMYKKTADTEIKADKDYFTRGASADANGVYEYTKVASPDVDDINTYYELEAAIGNFSGKNEDEILDDLFALPNALDKYTAGLVEDMIDALPALKNVTVGDEAAVKAAKDAYGKLTDAQKIHVPNYSEIGDLETKIAALKVSAVIDPIADQIDDLPKATALTLADEAAVDAAAKAYDKLSDANKTAFNSQYEALKTKLDGCKTAMKSLIDAAVAANAEYKAAKAAFAASESIGVVNAANLAAAKDLIAKYDALSGHAKEYFDEEDIATKGGLTASVLYKRLVAAVHAYEQYVAE